MSYRLRFVARLFGYADAASFPWGQLRYDQVLAVRSHLVESGRKPATVNACLCALVGVAREAWQLGQLDGDELARIRSVPRERGERLPPGRVVGRDEVAALLGACRSDARGVAGARDAAVLALLFGAGLRRCEPCRPSLDAYRAQTGELRVVGKGGRERRVYLAAGAAEALGAWLVVRGPAPGPLVVALDRYNQVARPLRALTPSSVDSIVRRRSAAAELSGFSTHDARRSYITSRTGARRGRVHGAAARRARRPEDDAALRPPRRRRGAQGGRARRSALLTSQPKMFWPQNRPALNPGVGHLALESCGLCRRGARWPCCQADP